LRAETPTDGQFRFRAKPGLYDVSATVTQTERRLRRIQGRQSSMRGTCWQGDSERVQVRRHRFSRVELQLQNVCVV
jgi:hypothetical protein